MGKSSVRSMVLAASVFASCAASTAQAQDRWSGLYMGVGVGVAWGDADWKFANNLIRNPDTIDLGKSLAGSVFAGYQRQFGNFVAGVEAKWSFADLEGSASCFGVGVTCHVESTGIGSIGGRLGYAFNNALIYGTGGYAQTNVKSHFEINNNKVVFSDNKHSGHYLGAGLDYALSDRLSLGVEYTHYSLDTRYHVSGIVSRYIDPSYDTIQARLTFKFGHEHRHVEPLK
jgi:outer membrane immunogenic protein